MMSSKNSKGQSFQQAMMIQANDFITYLEWKCLHFNQNFTVFFSYGSCWLQASIGLGNGLAPNRKQAITWTNADQDSWCHMSSISLNSSPPRTKWPPFRRRHVQMHFLEWKYLNFKQNFIEIRSLGSNWQYVGIGSDNGLAPSRRTNLDPVHWRIYAALGGDELMGQHLVTIL